MWTSRKFDDLMPHQTRRIGVVHSPLCLVLPKLAVTIKGLELYAKLLSVVHSYLMLVTAKPY